MRAEFEVHMLNESGKQKAQDIAWNFEMCLNSIEIICGAGSSGREMAIVRTKLEEACFFAKKAMARQSENQA